MLTRDIIASELTRLAAEWTARNVHGGRLQKKLRVAIHQLLKSGAFDHRWVNNTLKVDALHNARSLLDKANACPGASVYTMEVDMPADSPLLHVFSWGGFTNSDYEVNHPHAVYAVSNRLLNKYNSTSGTNVFTSTKLSEFREVPAIEAQEQHVRENLSPRRASLVIGRERVNRAVANTKRSSSG